MITVTASPSGYQAGDAVILTSVETRWWRKLWYACTLRPCPPRRQSYNIVAVTDNTTMEIK